MPTLIERQGMLFCDFCGKRQDFVATLVAGKHSCICNECVDLCLEISDKARKGTLPTETILRTPGEATADGE